MQTDLQQFKQYWSLLAIAHQWSDGLGLKVYQRLEAAYTEPHRYYHSVQHIVECLGARDGSLGE